MQDSKRDLAGDPSLSIIVPAHNAAKDIAACLATIRAGDVDFPCELIVVDDASTDETAKLARTYADRVLPIEGNARGPAAARNLGVSNSRAPIVAFIDADVVVHRDALTRMMNAFSNSETVAVFGSYDADPAARGTVSQYRNLLHHFVHQKSAGSVQSFWAGCGAVRKNAFENAGGFDEKRFKRAEMEDVELGYRLIDAGGKIELDPTILCTHRKKITLASMIKGDFTRRGVPWARVLLERGWFLNPKGLSLGASERLSAMTAVAFALFAAGAIAARSSALLLAAAIALLIFAAVNRALFSRMAHLRGPLFATAAIPLHLIYNLTAVAALLWALLSHPFNQSVQERYIRPR